MSRSMSCWKVQSPRVEAPIINRAPGTNRNLHQNQRWCSSRFGSARSNLSVAGSIVAPMFDIDFTALDADGTLATAGTARAVAERAEVVVLQAAAHWADLHGDLDHDHDGRSLPGMEQLGQLGGDGTPGVAEFAPAELGAELAMSPFAARQLIADALDLRHRLPLLWARVQAGEVKPWIGRKTAEATRDTSADVAAAVDRRVANWAHSLSWGRLENMIAAAIIAADPAAATEAAEATERSQGVWVGRSSEHGIKDIYIRTEAPNAIWFDASIDRVADSLAALGDTDAKDIRRAKAGRCAGAAAAGTEPVRHHSATGRRWRRRRRQAHDLRRFRSRC